MKFSEGEGPLFLLTDNGSIRSASALALQSAARDLAERTGCTVEAASIAHSDRIPPEELNHRPARILKQTLLDPSIPDSRSIVILPFFLGNRGAIVLMVEKVVAEILAERPGLSIRIAPFLFEEDGENQDMLARAVAERVREQISPEDSQKANVVLVDHGSPRPVAAQVRNFVAGQLQAMLKKEVRSVIPASMERREGKQYAFTDPLLEEVLRRPVLQGRPTIIALFFLLPGRHAGESGDVAEIREAAEADCPELHVKTTALLGDHPILREALAEIIRSFV